ncbi:hypothetical protein BJ166DRAFT_606179 [Pestalotiopsis sp. NC0098]|nr:hypothetical protein BJ166DRAFT_606179 [Pestalotiopsis sp. NC0098]
MGDFPVAGHERYEAIPQDSQVRETQTSGPRNETLNPSPQWQRPAESSQCGERHRNPEQAFLGVTGSSERSIGRLQRKSEPTSDQFRRVTSHLEPCVSTKRIANNSGRLIKCRRSWLRPACPGQCLSLQRELSIVVGPPNPDVRGGMAEPSIRTCAWGVSCPCLFLADGIAARSPARFLLSKVTVVSDTRQAVRNVSLIKVRVGSM